MLSFPRRKDGFIQRQYDRLVAEKQVEKVVVPVLIDPNLPANLEGILFL